MITLGIDPGSKRIGYGVVENIGHKSKMLASGILDIKSEKTIPHKEIKTALELVIKKFNPSVAGIEKLYFAKNQKTGLAVSESRGVIMLCLSEHNILVKEMSPSEVKLGITGYGAADKKAVAKMTRMILNEPGLKVLDDVTDALAMAIIASGIVRQENLPLRVDKKINRNILL